MALPSRSLAVAVAEEWESQHEKIDVRHMHLTTTLTRGIRVQEDPELADYMRIEIQKFLENDQICQREDPNIENDYKRGLAKMQAEMTDPLFDFLRNEFDINLNIQYDMGFFEQDKSISKIVPILEALDPLVIYSIYQLTQTSKSAALAMAVIKRPSLLSLDQAVHIARLDE